MLDYSNLKFVPFDDDMKIGEKIDVESFIKIEDGISLDQLKEIKAAFQVSFLWSHGHSNSNLRGKFRMNRRWIYKKGYANA